MAMILQKLEIERPRWGEYKGRYVGQITIEGESGSITLNLTPDHIARMFAVVAESVIVTAKDAAACLTTEAMATSTLPAPRSV